MPGSGRRRSVPDAAAMTTTDSLESMMDRAWPAPESMSIGGWRARFADGITRRANSVLPDAEPADVDAAIAAVERAYAERGLPPIFQITPAAQPSDLDSRLADRGYRVDGPTRVLVETGRVSPMRLRADAIVSVEPSEAWMDLWWLVDGRGDSAARAVAHTILTGVPALYGSIMDDNGVAAVGRVAPFHGWAGIYCMAVRPDARRRGLGAAMLRMLSGAAGGRRLWLQVLADNGAAHALYASAGFTPAFAHHYRVRDAM
jgi:ribosomal protein S18 acetylase RimI-like enzyme